MTDPNFTNRPQANISLLKPTVQMLRDVKLLDPLTEAELTKLIQVGKVLPYEAHSNIVIEGELSWGMYLILEGMVGIFKTNKLTGQDYDIGQIRAGSFFGEMSLVDTAPRSATVKALSDCQLFFVSKDVFEKFLGSSADLKVRFYESCVRTLVARLREIGDNYVVSQYQLWQVALKKGAA